MGITEIHMTIFQVETWKCELGIKEKEVERRVITVPHMSTRYIMENTYLKIQL